MKIKGVILDNDQSAVIHLKNLISYFDNIEIVGAFNKAIDASQFINGHNVDVLNGNMIEINDFKIPIGRNYIKTVKFQILHPSLYFQDFTFSSSSSKGILLCTNSLETLKNMIYKQRVDLLAGDVFIALFTNIC